MMLVGLKMNFQIIVVTLSFSLQTELGTSYIRPCSPCMPETQLDGDRKEGGIEIRRKGGRDLITINGKHYRETWYVKEKNVLKIYL